MKIDAPLTDAERFPLLTERGQSTLKWMREHACAPRFNHNCGDRLTQAGLERVRAYESTLDAPFARSREELPDWLPGFIEKCVRDVPFYRRRARGQTDFRKIEPCRREDLGREPWSFVPDSQALDDLIVYNTTGTTGHPIDILCHPEFATTYLPLLRAALARHNIVLEGVTPEQARRVSIVLVCAQKRTFTYATVSSYLGEAGFLKLNLNPSDWRHPDDRVQFLDECAPEIYTGDPVSFLELMRLPLQHRPKALVSTALTLLPAWKAQLEAHFGCPVFDFYGMNESGPIAFSAGKVLCDEPAHELFAPDLYVEILRPDNSICDEDERGEIVLSGGRNPFLPLLRYRTGDFARLQFRNNAPPLLLGLEGRAPVLFRSQLGAIINNIDVTNALRRFPIAQFTLHQRENGSLVFRTRGDVAHDVIRTALQPLFGDAMQVDFEISDENDGEKRLQYTSDMSEGISA